MSDDGPWQPPFDRRSAGGPPAGDPDHERRGYASAPHRSPHDPGQFERSAYGHPPVDPPRDPRRIEQPAYDRRRVDRERVDDASFGPRHGAGGGQRSEWPEPEPLPLTRRPDARRAREPEQPDAPGRTRALVAVAAVVVLGVAAAVVVRQGGGGGGTPGAGAGGWEADQFGNSQMLDGSAERVCSVSADKLLYCLDPATGEERFTHQFYDGVVTSPVLADDQIILASSNAGSAGTLHAFSAEGDSLWQTEVGVSTERQMPVVDGVVGVVSGDATNGELIGFDVSSGDERWRIFSADDESQPHVVSSNAFTDGDRFYVAVAVADPDAATGVSGQVVAVDAASGEVIWQTGVLPSISWSRGITTLAPVEDGSAVVVLLDGAPAGLEADQPEPRQLMALDSATGEVRWETSVAHERAAVAQVGDVTVAVDGVDLRGLDRDGAQVWTAAAPADGASGDEAAPVNLVFEGGHLFAVGRDVYEIDPASGESARVIDSGTTRDVAVAGDHLVVSGVFAVSGVPLADLPLGTRPVTVVTG